MSYQEHKKVSPITVKCAVITTSDSRTAADDETGNYIKQQLMENGHSVTHYAILKNDPAIIGGEIKTLLSHDDVQAIITSGGTGLGKKDVTVNTARGFLDKELEGFGELFRSLSYQEIGAGAMRSRALAGIVNGKVIICLAGSVNAARLALQKLILPELGHMVREASSCRHSIPCRSSPQSPVASGPAKASGNRLTSASARSRRRNPARAG